MEEMKTEDTAKAEVQIEDRADNVESNSCDGCTRACLACSCSKDTKLQKKVSLKSQIYCLILGCVLVYMVIMLTYWISAKNSVEDVGIFVYEMIQVWIEVWLILFVLTCISLALLLVMLAFLSLHLYRKWKGDIHLIYIIVAVLFGVGCLVVTIVMYDMWMVSWPMLVLFWRVTFPALFGVAVFVTTLFSWPLAAAYFAASECKGRLTVLLVLYCCWLILLLVSPAVVNVPCVVDKLSARPGVVAHRGASALTPENTLLAFETALKYNVSGVETDVRFSADDVPFLMHDPSLERTTNIKDVFPDHMKRHPSRFNFSDLRQLDAGSWYTERSSYGKRYSGSEDLSKQKIPSFHELLLLLKSHDVFLMYDPIFRVDQNYTNIIYNEVSSSGFPIEKVTHFVSPAMGDVNVSDQYMMVSRLEYQYTIEQLQELNVSLIIGEHYEFDESSIRMYKSKNISTLAYIVNSDWMYCLFWCEGIDYITTDECHVFTKTTSNTWHMTPVEYRVLWICLDIFALVTVIAVFVFTKRRKLHHWTIEKTDEDDESI